MVDQDVWSRGFKIDSNRPLRPEDIEALGRLLVRDIEQHPNRVSPRMVAHWMDADDRFARWVEENQPGMAEVASAYRTPG